jgi:hypothetical protein
MTGWPPELAFSLACSTLRAGHMVTYICYSDVRIYSRLEVSFPSGFFSPGGSNRHRWVCALGL